MSDDPNIQPVPVLSYHTEQQPPALRTLVRWALWAEAANGLFTAVCSGTSIVQNWLLLRADMRPSGAKVNGSASC